MSVDQRRRMLESEVRELTKAIKDRGYWITGSQGQEVLNPALAARRQALEAIRKLEAGSPPEPTRSELDEFLADE